MVVSLNDPYALNGFQSPSSDFYLVDVLSYSQVSGSTVGNYTVEVLGNYASYPQAFFLVSLSLGRPAGYQETLDFTGGASGGSYYYRFDIDQNSVVVASFAVQLASFSQDAILLAAPNGESFMSNLGTGFTYNDGVALFSTDPIAPGTVLTLTSNGVYTGSAQTTSGTITGLYFEMLGRAPSDSDVTNWVNAVNAGITIVQIQIAIAASAEAQADINADYQSILGRAADPGGAANATQVLAQSASMATVRSMLANSPEAQNDINSLYQQILGRPVDASGLSNWQQALSQTGGSVSAISAALGTSGEAASDINALYRQILGRTADTAGLASFEQALAVGSITLSGVRATLASSAEAAADINTLYQQILGRSADPSGLAAFQQNLAQQGSLATIQATLANSSEAAADINTAYQQILGRPVDSGALSAYQTALAQSGNSLQSVRAALAGSAEAQADINALYQQVLNRPADPGGLTTAEHILAQPNGSLSLLQATLAGSSEAQNDINVIYTQVLGRPLDSPSLPAWQGFLSAAGGSMAAVRSDVIASAEAQSALKATLQAAEGHTPTASDIAAGQLQITAGLSLSDLRTQTLALASNPTFINGTVTNSATTAVLDPQNGVTVFDFSAGLDNQFQITGLNALGNFAASHSILELSRSQFPNLAAVIADEHASGGGTLISLSPSASILIQSTPATSLVPADFRFV